MALPVVVSSSSYHSGATTLMTIPLTDIATGSWMVLSAMTVGANTLASPAGWTVFKTNENSGTRRNYLFAKIKEASDTAVTFSQDGTNSASYGLIWGTGAVDIVDWNVGASWLRSSSSQAVGARYDTIAPSVTTTTENHLVLAIAHEATNVKTQAMEVTAVAPSGWTQQMWLEQVAPYDRIETIWMGTKPQTDVGSSGDLTLTYVTPQDSNSWAIQIAIAGEVADATPPPAPIVVGAPTTGTVVHRTITLGRPAGAIAGDYVVVVVRGQSSTATAEPASTGFTRLGAAFMAENAQFRLNGIYGRPITNISTEPTSYDFTYVDANSNRAIAVAFLVRGVDLDNPLAGASPSYGGTVITNGRTTESYTVAAFPALQLFYGGSEFAGGNSNVPTAPAGFTQVASMASSAVLTDSRTYIWVGQRELTVDTAPAVTITWGAPSSPAAQSVALRGTNAVPPNPAGDGITAYDGAGNATKVYYTTADGPRTPSAIIPVRRGFDSVAQMLATPGFTWAHRGGSASYPEHSLYAYTQSVVRGYGVLEISMGRTSDGVWFGLHNQTTDATSGGTYGNASAQTWAQIQAQQIVVGAQGAPQPYMRWSELVAAYGRSHVFVVDPKYALGSYRTEFLNMIDATVGPTRAIVKYSGVGSGSAALSTDAQARGYQTWGYFYATDASAAQGGNGALQTWAPSWTLLGMEYNASQAIWDECLAFGKPVIGHIAPNQAAYDMAMAKGASGVQVSGVGVVAPVSWWT